MSWALELAICEMKRDIKTSCVGNEGFFIFKR